MSSIFFRNLSGISGEFRSKKRFSPASCLLLHFRDANVILRALKRSEDNPENWILRAYECPGKTASISLESEIGLKLENSIDGLERPTEPVREITPWKIATWRISRQYT